MNIVSRLEVCKGPLVLDASVVINLAASCIMGKLLESINLPVIIPKNVLAESLINPATGQPIQNDLSVLEEKKLIHFSEVDASSFDEFLALTGAPSPKDIHDGEAATIAISLALKGHPVIDDRKAFRRCIELYPNLHFAHTVDFFCHSTIKKSLTEEALSQGLLRALTFSRMWMPREYGKFVILTIGNDNFMGVKSISSQIKRELIGVPI